MKALKLPDRIGILPVLIFIFSLFATSIFSQLECPDNFDLPEDSDVSDPNCAFIDVDDGVIILSSDPCSYQFSVELDLDIPAGTVVTDHVIFDINIVDENLNYTNMNCLDNVYSLQVAGGLVENFDCGTDNTFEYNGAGISLGDLMSGNYLEIGVDRPNEFEDNCFHFVFEFTYTDLNGVTCSYFGELVLDFPVNTNFAYSCGSIEYAGNDDCNFPNPISSDLDQFLNFANSFQGTYTSMCGYEVEINPEVILPFNGDICFPVPPGGCTEIELKDCPGDVSDEGCINGMDLVELRKVILGVTTGTPGPYGGLMGDVNESGGVSTLDLVLIQRWILGLADPQESNVGDCVIFDPNDDILSGGDLDGLGSWIGHTGWTVEVCDGQDFEVVMGVMGDVNGDCPCDVVEGPIGGAPPEVVISCSWNRGQCTMVAPDIGFYDMTLDMIGAISGVDLSSSLGADVEVGIFQREDGYALTINSLNGRVLSLSQCLAEINLYGSGPVTCSSHSFLIDSETNLRLLTMGEGEGSGRNTTVEDIANDNFEMKVMGSSVHIYNTAFNGLSTELRLFTTDGKLLSTKQLSGFDEMVDFTDELSAYPKGSLFVVMGICGDEQHVKKMVW